MLELMTRDDWGAAEPKSRRLLDLTGPTYLHWNGTGMKWKGVEEDARESWIRSRLQIGQSFHMNTKGWSDIAYSFAVDPWGLGVWELRGLDVRPGATKGYNNESHAIYVMTGLGDGPVTDRCLTMIDLLVDEIATAGTAERKLLGHRDVGATSCPGDYLYGLLALFNDNAFEPTEPEFIQRPDRPMGEPVAIFKLGNGYVAVDEKGRAVAKGTSILGDLRSVPLDHPIVDAEGTPTGRGYVMVASDGGVFCFGDAAYHGSVRQALGGAMPDKPIISVEVEENGYYLIASDGGVFAFGDVAFKGSFVEDVG